MSWAIYYFKLLAYDEDLYGVCEDQHLQNDGKQYIMCIFVSQLTWRGFTNYPERDYVPAPNVM